MTTPNPEQLTDADVEVRDLTCEDFEGMRPLSEVDPGMIEAVKAWLFTLDLNKREDLETWRRLYNGK